MMKKNHGQLKKVFEAKIPPLKWWVCVMVDRHGGGRGGHFMVSGQTPPSGKLDGGNCTIAADSYEVVYGPGTYAECEEYMDDMGGIVQR